MKFTLEYFNASYLETVSEGQSRIDVGADTFSSVINGGQFVGWIRAEELFLEDHGFDEYEGVDLQMDAVELMGVNSEQSSVHSRVAFELELDDEPDGDDDFRELLNAITPACMVKFWSEPESSASSHPDRGKGLFWFNGKINRAWVDGELIHSRN